MHSPHASLYFLIHLFSKGAEAAADSVFRDLAGFVDLVADGKETIILSSGKSVPETPSRATLGWPYSGLRLMLVIVEFIKIKN